MTEWCWQSLYCLQLQHPVTVTVPHTHTVIPCWSLGKVRLVTLSRQEMTGMISSSLRDYWRLSALATPRPLHHTQFLETERQSVWILNRVLFSSRGINGGDWWSVQHQTKKGMSFKMAQHIQKTPPRKGVAAGFGNIMELQQNFSQKKHLPPLPSVPFLIHIFLFVWQMLENSVNIKKHFVFSHVCTFWPNWTFLPGAKPVFKYNISTDCTTRLSSSSWGWRVHYVRSDCGNVAFKCWFWLGKTCYHRKQETSVRSWKYLWRHKPERYVNYRGVFR